MAELGGVGLTHIGVCALNCKQCSQNFDTAEERRTHQRITHYPRKQSNKEPLISSAGVEQQTQPSSPKQPRTPNHSHHGGTLRSSLTPSSSSVRSLDKSKFVFILLPVLRHCIAFSSWWLITPKMASLDTRRPLGEKPKIQMKMTCSLLPKWRSQEVPKKEDPLDPQIVGP